MSKNKDETKTKERRLSGGLFWNPNINDELVGKLVAIREGNYKKDIYDLQTDKGIITVPASAVLEGVINQDLIDKKLRVKFLGWGANKLAEKAPGLYRFFEVFLIEE